MSSPLRSAVIGIVSLLLTSARADVDSLLTDAAARIDYGFLTGDAALVVSARDSLSGRTAGPWRDYLIAYAGFREAELRQAQGQDADAAIESCERRGEIAAAVAETEAEATILIAACAALAARAEPLRSVLHLRRMRQALARAADIAPDNPRRLLIVARFAAAVAAESGMLAEAAVAAFRAQAGDYAFPSWGEAEALTLVGGQRLASGELRAARDLLEEALLIAPDYTAALELRRRLLRLAAAN